MELRSAETSPEGDIPLRLRPPARPSLFTAHPRELPSLLLRYLASLRVVPRLISVGRSRSCRASEWSNRSLALLAVRPPLWLVIDTLFVDDQPIVLADRFDQVRGGPSVALGTLVRAELSSDILVEVSFVDVSGAIVLTVFREFAFMTISSATQGPTETDGIGTPVNYNSI